jgi:23S rRNA (guanosine2251-2'-O)-methyltransferase
MARPGHSSKNKSGRATPEQRPRRELQNPRDSGGIAGGSYLTEVRGELLAGRNAVYEALRAGRRQVSRVLLAENAEEKGTLQQIVQICRRRGIALTPAPRYDLDEMGAGLEHQGVIAEVSAYPYVELDDLLAVSQQRQEDPFLLMLDSLQDPQNVGSLLRTAEAVGIHGVIVPERRAVGITPAVSRASAGAVEHLAISMVTNLVRTIEELKAKGIWVVGVEEHPSAQDYRRVDLKMPLALVMGSEGAGMRRLVLERCDLIIRIPMQGQIASLNVAVAGSILLYQAWSARHPTELG